MWFFRFLYAPLYDDVKELKTQNYFFKLAHADFLSRIQKLEKRIEVLNDRIDTLENFYYSLDEVR